MRKRMMALLLTLAVLLPMLGGIVPEAKATKADLESEIRQQLDTYIANLGTPNPSAARSRLTNHAMSGKGAYLHMDEADVFAVALLNSNLMQMYLRDTLSAAVLYTQAMYQNTLHIGGNTGWYNEKLFFTNGVYTEFFSINDDDERVATLNSRSTESGWVMTPNACDNAMVDVVGGSRIRMIFRRTAITTDTITCHVELQVFDDFDFNSGFNTSNLIGNLLTGTLIDPYGWDVCVDFSFTITNTCTHESGNYYWRFDEKNDLISVTMDGADSNPLSRQKGTTENGVFQDTSYRITTPIKLHHDQPWSMEIKCQGNGFLFLTSGNTLANGGVYLRKAANTIFFGEYDYLNESDETPTLNHYGVWYTTAGFSAKDSLTYRLNNVIGGDGSNMVYLYVNDVDLGPMHHYYQSGTSMKTTSDWLNGRDLSFAFIGGSGNPLKDISVEYVRVWETGKDNAPYSYFEITTAAPTCTEPGKNIHTCSLCGASYSEATGEPAMGHTLEVIPGTAATCETDGLTEGTRCTTCGETVTAQEVIPALGHAWDEGTVIVPAACETDGEIRFTCNRDPSHTRVDTITPPGHAPGDPASCTAAQTCNSCGIELFPALGHTWNEGEVLTKPSPEGDGLTKFTCDVCGEIREEIQKYEGPVRIAGRDRFETALLTADQMKKNLGIEKFDAVIVASGLDFADALAGSYLASTKNAPILLAYTKDSVNDGIRHYIRENLKEGGTVYILGGENAVPTSFEEELETFQVKRLAGKHRFETNLMILAEAGISDKPLLISTGLTFADSLSASAAKLPILLVYGDKLLPEQADFLTETGERPLYILGGEGAVSGKMAEVLTAYGTVERVAGNNRFETSVKIAEKFFDSPESAVLAYAWDFPDGLCGGPLAVTMNAPLILTMANYEESASNYVQFTGISHATILGGEKLIPQQSVNTILN